MLADAVDAVLGVDTHRDIHYAEIAYPSGGTLAPGAGRDNSETADPARLGCPPPDYSSWLPHGCGSFGVTGAGGWCRGCWWVIVTCWGVSEASVPYGPEVRKRDQRKGSLGGR